MCGICGCSDIMHDKPEGHHHAPGKKMFLLPETYEKNRRQAELNHTYFKERHILAINVFSTPGSGKTALLAETTAFINGKMPIMVIVGDQETHVDKEKIKSIGAEVVQINSSKNCHLDAGELGTFVKQCQPADHAILFIENASNLICPALFELGEALRIVVLPVTEGDHKPLKFPDMFAKADLLLITKTDLAPFNNFSVAKCIENAKIVNPSLTVIEISTVNGKGLKAWCEWLQNKYQATEKETIFE